MSREIVPGVVEVLFARALVHAYIAWADVPTLIDTGTPGAAKTLITALETSDLRPEDIGRIVLTHAHADHAGNAAQLAQLSGAEVHVSPIQRRSCARAASSRARRSRRRWAV